MIKLYWLLFAVVLFSACSKEKSFEQKIANPVDTTGNPSGGLLVKMVGKPEGKTDSTIVTFGYNTAGKITNMFSTTVGLIDEEYNESEVKYYRNNSGMINRYVHIEKVRKNSTVLYSDSIVHTLHLNAGHYIYTIREVPDEPGKPILDSIVYSYDNKDRFSSVVIWRKDKDNGNQLFKFQETVYTYDGKNNIAMMSITFKDDIDTNDPPQIIKLTYGDKSSPINLGVDGQLDGFITHGFSSPNNLLLLDNPDFPQKTSYSYEFNAASKPVKAVETDLLTREKININYYYK